MKFGRNILAACAVLAATATFHSEAQQAPSPPVDRDEAIPTSGLGATTSGQRVLLLPDGTWKVNEFYRSDEITALSDHGRNVTLTREVDPKTKEPVLRWRYSTGHGGPLQVVVSRAISTDKSLHSQNDNCIPVITIRNLTDLQLFRVVTELEFRTESGSVSSASIMAGPLDDGEQADILGNPLLVPGCKDLTAILHIPFCTFDNGLDCRSVVRASKFGTIPTELAKWMTQKNE